MNDAGDDQTRLAWGRLTVARYARQLGWTAAGDELSATSWRGRFVSEFTTEAGTHKNELVAWRRSGAAFTSLRFPVAMSAGVYRRERERILGIIADHDLAGPTTSAAGEPPRLEISTRLYDPGLNLETFEAAVESLFACEEALRSFT